jgi:hypothetical protein
MHDYSAINFSQDPELGRDALEITEAFTFSGYKAIFNITGWDDTGMLISDSGDVDYNLISSLDWHLNQVGIAPTSDIYPEPYWEWGGTIGDTDFALHSPPVPEPATIFLLSIGLGGIALLKRSKANRNQLLDGKNQFAA